MQRGPVQISPFGVIVTLRFASSDRARYRWSSKVGYRAQQDAMCRVARGGVDVFGLGFQELIIILVIALVIFGGKKLPEVGSGLGKAIREFKRGTSGRARIEPERHSATVTVVTRRRGKAEPRADTRLHASPQEVDDSLHEAPESRLIAWMHIITSDNAAGDSCLPDICQAEGVFVRSQGQ
jgi:sec-independent protein translocase protein TatA